MISCLWNNFNCTISGQNHRKILCEHPSAMKIEHILSINKTHLIEKQNELNLKPKDNLVLKNSLYTFKLHIIHCGK